jgi:hypothetical protein
LRRFLSNDAWGFPEGVHCNIVEDYDLIVYIDNESNYCCKALVSQVILRSSGTDICFIILYNILKIAELDCCQIIILSIYVPSTHAYAHVFALREKVTV